jgi:Holliday junction resolvase-like predicted endonuclease
MVLRQSIEKLLVESENSFVPDPIAGFRGEALELAVCDWLKSRGYRIALRRFKTPFAEIDILVMSPRRDFLVIEVKSSGWPDDSALNLSHIQRRRLKRACQWISEELADLPSLSTDMAVDLRLVVPAATRHDSFQMIAIF